LQASAASRLQIAAAVGENASVTEIETLNRGNKAKDLLKTKELEFSAAQNKAKNGAKNLESGNWKIRNWKLGTRNWSPQFRFSSF
jgi:hypothetical protein